MKTGLWPGKETRQLWPDPGRIIADSGGNVKADPQAVAGAGAKRGKYDQEPDL